MATQHADPLTHLPLSPLAFHVLLALAEEERHGYGIIRDIEQRSGGQMSVRSGALYTMLQRLLESGLVDQAPLPDAEIDPRRKYYRITSLGREVAALEGARLRELVDAAYQRHLLSEREVG